MREKRPIIYSILFLIGAFVTFLGVSLITALLFQSVPALENAPLYLQQVVIDLGFFTAVFIYMRKTGYLCFLKERRTGFFKGLFVGGYFLFAGIITLISQAGLIDGKSILPIQDIILYIVAMFLVGLAEETVFRGVISNIFFQSYKSSSSGVKLSVLLSGILFGLFHMVNSVGGQIKLSGVLAQVLITIAMGMLFTAIYYRTRNLWVVIFLHAFIDFAALFVTGIIGTQSASDVIGEYSAANLVSIFPIAIATAYLLRKPKMEEIIKREDASEQNSTCIDGEWKGDAVATIDNETKDYTKALHIVITCYVLVVIASAIMLSVN